MMQPISDEIWDSKYRLKDRDGNPVDRDRGATFERIADALAGVEERPSLWREKFLWALENGAIPGGRIASNAGAGEHKPATSLINCLAGDTQVLTRKGVVPIRDLAGLEVEVLNGGGSWVRVPFKSFGTQKTYALTWRWASNKRNKVVVRATADHRWFLSDGRVVTTEYWLTGPVERTRRSVPHLRPIAVAIDAAERDRGLLHGLVYGDGTWYSTYATLPLCGPKRELANRVERMTGIAPRSYATGSNCEVTKFHLPESACFTDFKELPAGCSDSYLRGFLAGLLATDGSVTSNGPGCEVVVYGTLELVEFLARQLPVIGVGWTYRRKCGRAGDKTNLAARTKDLWSIGLHASTILADDLLRSEHKARFRQTPDGESSIQRWVLESVDRVPMEEEVFCCHEPATTAFALAWGLKTGQCTVSGTISDDLDGIMRRLHEAALTLKAGCGIGYPFSSLRPKGARVSGAGANTSGPLSFMDIYDAMCATISSAGGRRGAQMGTFAADHPDVFDFVRAKRENGRLRHFNLSVLVPDRLLDAVKNGEIWPLRFPGHPESDRDVPAVELWDAIMRSTYEFSEPGVLFVDRINGDNNNWFAEKIEATNPCLAEGTYVATPDGYRRVETIAEGDAVLTALGTVGFVGRKEVHDDVPVYDVELSDGAVVRATAAHIFHSKPTGINSRKWGKNARLHELSSGDQLRVVDAMPGRDLTPPLCGMDERDKGFFVGVVLGDGCFTDNTKALKISVGLDQKEWCDKLREFFSGYGVSCSVYEDKTAYVITLLDGARRSLENFGLKPALSTDKVLPDFVYRAGREFLSGLVDGLVSTDGNIHMHSANPMVRVSSRSLELLRGVKRVLNMLGVHARIYACKKTDTAIDGRDIRFSGPVNVLCVLGRDIRTVAGLGITHYQRRARLEELVLDYQLSGGTRCATIKSIKPAGKARVYDLFEPNTDTWVTDGGIVSRGCGELPLPPNGSCLLGSVDLTRFVLDPLTAKARFDWERYRDVVGIFTRMLDNVVGIANLPLPAQAEELRRKRRHGMGVLGVGSALAMLGERYGSPESCALVDRWMASMALEGWRQALELAKEKGPAPIMEEEFAEHGCLKGKHLHAQSRYMRRIAMIDPGLVDALARVGARFTHHTAIAPTGTIAIAFADNASNGIEPSFAHRYVRNLTVAGRKTRQATTVHSAEARLWGKMFGDRPYPEHFVTAEQVAPKEHIDVQAAAQKWVDSSVSKTINVPPDMSFEAFEDLYRYAHEKGLKGCATFRYNPEVFQGVLVTEDKLAGETYRFTLADGTTVEARGDQIVEYDGETHTAANLFDALKEGKFGRY